MPPNHHSKTDKFRQNSDVVSDDDLMLDTERTKMLNKGIFKICTTRCIEDEIYFIAEYTK